MPRTVPRLGECEFRASARPTALTIHFPIRNSPLSLRILRFSFFSFGLNLCSHGVASLDLETTPAPTASADRAIGVSFKWSKIDVKNFLAWLVDQKANAGVLDSLLMNSAKAKKPMSRKMRKLLKRLRALKRLPTAGQHGGLWWYKVQCNNCNAGTILGACAKYNLKPACDHTAYSDGKCVNSNYNQGRHLSYPPHALEGWQHNFFPQCHIYAGMANGGHPLQNTGSTHRWSYGESGNTVCVSSERPQFNLLKKYRDQAE
jgi:hypothetical protein